MKQVRVSKRRLTIIAAVVAVLGLTFSLLAETAGGVTLHHASDTAQHTTVSYTPPANPAGGVGLDTMGVGASLAAADFTTTPAPATTAADISTTTTLPSSTSPSESPADPDSTPHTTPTPPQPVTPPTEPCKCPATMNAQLCVYELHCTPEPTPTPPPTCRACGYRELQTNGHLMCPMYVCPD